MTRINWQSYIVIDKDIHHGEPCIKGMRVPVSTIVGSIADGMTIEQVIQEYPQLKQEDIQAASEYATRT